MMTVNISSAWCSNYVREFALFLSMEQAIVDIRAIIPEISHVLGGGAASVLWTVEIRTVTLFVTSR
jgi:hypothetical protein